MSVNVDLYRYFISLDTHCHINSFEVERVINTNNFRVPVVTQVWQKNIIDGALCHIALEIGEECASEKLIICVAQLWYYRHDLGNGTVYFFFPHLWF